MSAMATKAAGKLTWAAPWWLILIEGGIFVALGLFLMINPASAVVAFGKAVALALAVWGLVGVVVGFGRDSTSSAANVAFYRAIAALVTGGGIIVLLLFNLLGVSLGLTILSIGLLVVGALSLYLAFVNPPAQRFRFSELILAVVMLLLGVAGLFYRDSNIVDGWIAWAMLIFGGILIVVAFLRRGKADEQAVAV
jgi:uncharacterized membrane protein HdeD (DUF308 family)